jgi:hypothetical protein
MRILRNLLSKKNNSYLSPISGYDIIHNSRFAHSKKQHKILGFSNTFYCTSNPFEWEIKHMNSR